MRNKIWGGFLLAAIVAAMVPAFANAQTIDTHSTLLSDNSDSPKFLFIRHELSGAKNYVNASFTISFEEDENNPAPVGNMPTGSQAIHFNRTPENDQPMTSLVSMNLSNLEFSKLGDYKFIVRETASSDDANYPKDEEHAYYVYVSVRNELENGVPTGNLVATMAAQVRDHDTGEKTDIVFASEVVRTYIELSKNVTGNLADTGEYFKFLVTINGHNGDSFTIDGQDANVTYGGENIATTANYIVSDDGVEVYLRHGQTITIGQDSNGVFELPINVTYTVQEIGAEDYTTTVDDAEGKITGTKRTAVLLEGNLLPEANQTTFVNNKNSAVLTGITLAMIPATVLIVSMFTGAVVVRKIKKSADKR